MKIINAGELDFKSINEQLRTEDKEFTISRCCGQRFIATGISDKKISIDGTPGNAMGAYLNGAEITVHANAQDAVGDTMNDGKIIIHGNVGDAVGYAMRGGKIYIKGNTGYRAGIHMKEYREKIPVMIIGGYCGSFLGEYQAGGRIIVLGIGESDRNIVGNFPGTGMHGGKIYLRSNCRGIDFPGQVKLHRATDEDMSEISADLAEFCKLFGYDYDEIINSEFTVAVPDSKNPYKQMYVAN